MLKRSEVSEWRMHPVTEKVFKVLEEDMNAYIAAVISGEVIGETVDETAQNVAKMVGTIAGISQVFDIEGDEDE